LSTFRLLDLSTFDDSTFRLSTTAIPMASDPPFTGVYTALVTPFSADGARLELDRLDTAIGRQAEGGVRGVVACGTTGESPTLTEREHTEVVERTVAGARHHGLSAVAGAGSNSTAHAVELHRIAHRLGADAALHVCPYYNKPSQEGLYRHFMTVADACDLPVMLYNIPGRTGVSLSLATIERLAGHPNIQALKEATGAVTLAGQVIARTSLAVLSGDDPLTLPLLALGATGVVSVLSNVAPGRVAALCRAMADGDGVLARRTHYELLPLAEALLALDGNPVPVKAALRRLGHDTGAVRPPLAPPTEATVEALEPLLADLDLVATTGIGA
jgi:4-hydroxy-tetrahydrodipicolinate synthase